MKSSSTFITCYSDVSQYRITTKSSEDTPSITRGRILSNYHIGKDGTTIKDTGDPPTMCRKVYSNNRILNQWIRTADVNTTPKSASLLMGNRSNNFPSGVSGFSALTTGGWACFVAVQAKPPQAPQKSAKLKTYLCQQIITPSFIF